MKIGIYCRDLTLPNGLTKATLATARALEALGHEVEVLAETAAPPARLSRLLGPAVSGARVVRVGPPSGAAGRRLAARTANYDLFINQLPGAYFPSFAEHSWLWVRSLPRARPRFAEYYRLLANSRFTRGAIKDAWGLESEILHPPVSPKGLVETRKERLLLSVGTLGSVRAPKNEAALIRLFVRLWKAGKLDGWTYRLAGAPEGGAKWLSRLRREAAGAPVFIHPSPPFSELRKLFGKASLLWHACGAGRDPRARPWSQEHFGIALVEAMAAGCLPLAPDRGGPRDTILHGKTGWLYRDFAELERLTLAATRERRDLEPMRRQARRRGRLFGIEPFQDRFRALLPSFRTR